MKRGVWAAIGTGVLFTAIGAWVGLQRWQPEPAQPSAAGRLFQQTMNDSSGAAQSLRQWKGKTLVVNFWATWCAPCVDEMPELSALQTELAATDVRIIGLGIDSPDNIAQFSAKYKISYPLYVAGMSGTALTRDFGNQAGGLPFTVIIGTDGTVKKTYLGRLKMDELRRDLQKL